jgi:hypothetical protein
MLHEDDHILQTGKKYRSGATEDRDAPVATAEPFDFPVVYGIRELRTATFRGTREGSRTLVVTLHAARSARAHGADLMSARLGDGVKLGSTMEFRGDLLIVLLLLTLGCGGKSQAAPDGGNADSSSSGGGSSGVNASSGGSSGRGDGSGSAGEGGPSGDGDADEVGDAWAEGTLDAEIPDAFPASCPQFGFAIEPDAAPDTCAFTQADVVCTRARTARRTSGLGAAASSRSTV